MQPEGRKGTVPPRGRCGREPWKEVLSGCSLHWHREVGGKKKARDCGLRERRQGLRRRPEHSREGAHTHQKEGQCGRWAAEAHLRQMALNLHHSTCRRRDGGHHTHDWLHFLNNLVFTVTSQSCTFWKNVLWRHPSENRVWTFLTLPGLRASALSGVQCRLGSKLSNNSRGLKAQRGMVSPPLEKKGN